MPKTVEQLGEAFARLPEALDRNMSIAVRMAAEMAANTARESHAYVDRSGVLTASISASDPTGEFSAGTLQASFGAGTGYAVFVELGTKAHVIRPKFRAMLRFPVEGGFVFSRGVRHPGTKPTMFLHKARDAAFERLKEDIVPSAVELSMAQAGI